MKALKPVKDSKLHPDKNHLLKMASQTLLLIILVLLIYLLARKNHNLLFLLLYLWTNSKSFAINFLSFIFLPGTLIHEISHWVMATMLRVPTGELSILPKIKMSGTTFAKATAVEEIQAGKLEIAKTDPFRHALIGLAPIFSGLAIIFVIGKLLSVSFPPTTYLPAQAGNLQPITFVGIYLLFVVSSSMFSSRKDLETMVIALPVTLVVILMLNYIGLRILFDPGLVDKIVKILTELNGYLIVCGIVDLFVLIFFQTNISMWQKILKKNVVAVKKD